MKIWHTKVLQEKVGLELACVVFWAQSREPGTPELYSWLCQEDTGLHIMCTKHRSSQLRRKGSFKLSFHSYHAWSYKNWLVWKIKAVSWLLPVLFTCPRSQKKAELWPESGQVFAFPLGRNILMCLMWSHPFWNLLSLVTSQHHCL